MIKVWDRSSKMPAEVNKASNRMNKSLECLQHLYLIAHKWTHILWITGCGFKMYFLKWFINIAPIYPATL